MTTTITDLDDFKALDPFFRIIEKGLERIADGGHFFDLLAEDVIFDYIITTSRLPKARRRPQGRRRALPPLRDHDRPRPMSCPRGPSRHQDRRRGARVRFRRSSRFDRGPVCQPVHFGTHDHRSQGHSLARLPRPRGGLRRARMAITLMDGASLLETLTSICGSN